MQDDESKLIVENAFLHTYLKYVANTESPTIMQVWSAISAASACMGRHLYLPFGIGDIYPNMFVLLVGPPGTRKSQAIKYASKLVAESTNVRFAPDDTGGQRQGLIAAMEGDENLDSEDQQFEIMDNAAMVADITSIGNLQVTMGRPEDKHHMFACASEFGTFMGEANSNTTRFLNKVWDGEDYKYKLSNSEKVLKEPLMTIVGGTTTADIARILPAEAIGQGFMSRWILVHAPNKEKRVARPFMHDEYKPALCDVFHNLSREMSGAIEESKAAGKYLDYMYTHETVNIQDTRFVYYGERRHTHLIKLAMVLAAASGSQVLSVEDVEQAENILAHTEARMPDALGEFGLTNEGAAKQKMLEFLQASNAPVTLAILWQIMRNDMTRVAFSNTVSDLVNSGKITEINTTTGQAVIFNDDIGGLFEEIAL